MQKRSFEEALKRRVESFAPAPKEGLWESVEAQIQPVKRKRRLVWLWFPVAVCILASAGLLVYNYNAMPGTAVQISARQTYTVVGNNRQPVHEHAENNYRDGGDVTTAKETETNNAGAAKSVSGTPEYKPSVSHTAGLHQSPVKADEISQAEAPVIPEPAKQQASDDIKAITESDDHNTVNTEFPEDTIKTLPVTLRKQPDTTAKPVTQIPPVVHKKDFSQYIAIILTPLLSQAQLSLDKQYKQQEPYQNDYDQRRSGDKGLTGYGVGFNWGVNMGRHHLYSGIQYASLGYKLYVRDSSAYNVKTSTSLNHFTAYTSDSFSVVGRDVQGGQYITSRYHYLTVPVGYGYTLLSKQKISIGITGNISYNLLLAYKGLVYQSASGLYVKPAVAFENHIRKSSFMVSGGFDVDYHIGGNKTLFLRPQYGMSLTPAEDAPLKTGYRFWMLGMGVKWLLK